MHDPVAKFKKSASLDVDKYVIMWKRNGNGAGQTEIKKSGVLDTLGYTTKWSVVNPVLAQDGDVMEVTVKAVDGGGVSSSTLIATLNIPVVPPEPPTELTLTLN